MLRRYRGKAIIRTRMILEESFNSILYCLIIIHLRNNAHLLRRKVVRTNGKKVLNRKLLRDIKAYCRKRFGSKRYWPYVALYTEVRGEYIEGWIPYDYFRFKLVPRLNPKPAGIMDFKSLDYRLFGDFAIRPLYLYLAGIYYDADLNQKRPEEVESRLSGYHDDIVIKEETGYGGLKVSILPASEFTPGMLRRDSNYVIQPRIMQHSILNQVYPDSVNTFRVNTFLKKDGSVTVKCIWLRFGADGSKVDNITSGGSFLYFDLKGKPEAYSYEPDVGFRLSDRHKNTGFVFSKLEIPMFHEILEECKNAHGKFPYVRLIAWDVCVDSTGTPKLIEWNTQNPDHMSVAAKWGPFWKDDSEIR